MISEFLEQHLSTPFPVGAKDIHVLNADLEMLDADVVSLAESYLEHGKLTAEQRPILEGCVAVLRQVVRELPEGMRDYFARLHALGVAVLNRLPARGPAA
jgi:hypothetical protein